MSAELARKFHEAYERLAPSFGYETRADTKAFDPESPNGKLMIAVCSELFSRPPASSERVALSEPMTNAPRSVTGYHDPDRIAAWNAADPDAYIPPGRIVKIAQGRNAGQHLQVIGDPSCGEFVRIETPGFVAPARGDVLATGQISMSMFASKADYDKAVTASGILPVKESDK
jgi:hypothetical protein